MSNQVYYYKGKPYTIRGESKIKIGGIWIEIVEYQAEYDAVYGKNYARFKKEFYELFKPYNEEVTLVQDMNLGCMFPEACGIPQVWHGIIPPRCTKCGYNPPMMTITY